MTAGLWVYDRSADIQGEKSFIVHVNQIVHAYDYTIQAVDIDDTGRGSVTLRVVSD
jgi:hypothetical protein